MAREERAALLAVAAATAAALVLRWIGFDQSLFGDEQLTRYAVADGAHGVLGRLDRFEQNPPLFFWLAALSRHLGGVEWIRLPSLIAGAAAVPLTYALGRLTLGARGPAVFAAALMALSPFLAFYGTEGRPYALMVALLLASTVCLLAALRRAGGWWWWAGMAVASAAALYTQYVAVFWLAAQGVWALWAAPQRWRGLLASCAGTALAFLPWLPSFLDQRELITLSEAITARGAARTFGQLAIGHPLLSLSDSLGTAGRWALVLVAGALAAGLALIAARRWRARPERPAPRVLRAVVLLVVLALGTPVGLWAYAHLGGGSFGLGRYWLASAAPAFLLAGGALAALPRPVAATAAATVLAVAGVVALDTMDGGLQRPRTAAAAALADRLAPPGVPVVEVAPLARVAQRIAWLTGPGQAALVQAAIATPGFAASPQSESYAIYYRRPHARFGVVGFRPGRAGRPGGGLPVVPLADPAAWRRAAARGRAIVLSPIANGAFEPPSPPPGLGARLVRRTRWPGFADVVADEYVLPRRRAR